MRKYTPKLIALVMAVSMMTNQSLVLTAQETEEEQETVTEMVVEEESQTTESAEIPTQEEETDLPEEEIIPEEETEAEATEEIAEEENSEEIEEIPEEIEGIPEEESTWTGDSLEEMVDSAAGYQLPVDNPAPSQAQDVWIEVIETPKKETNTYVFADKTVLMKNTDEKLRIILTNLTAENKDLLIKAIQDTYMMPLEDGFSIYNYVEYHNDNFVDAEKWSLNTSYDSFLCWAAVASNMIWSSGWADGLINPLTNRKFTSSDEILTYFSTYFTDKAGHEGYGITWLMNAIYWGSNQKNTAQPTIKDDKYGQNNGYGIGAEQAGLLPGILSTDIITIRNFSENPVTELDNIAKQLKKHAVGLHIGFYDEKEKYISAHTVTLVGIIMDEKASGSDKYKAILLADSDNYSVNANAKPMTMEEATKLKEERPNVYTLYYLELVEDEKGNQYWAVRDYLEQGSYTSRLDSVVYLDLKNTVNLKAVTEKIGTKDVLHTPDLTLTIIESKNKKQKTQTKYKEGEAIVLHTEIYNQGSALSAESSDKNIICNRIKIYKDGKLWKVIDQDIDLQKNGLNVENNQSLYMDSTLTENLHFSPGKYTVKYYYNMKDSNGNRIQEAYYKNNIVGETTFTVIEDPQKKGPDCKEKKSKQGLYDIVSMITAVFVNTSVENDIRYNMYDSSIDGKFYFDVRTDAQRIESLSCDGEEVDSAFYTIEAVSGEECFLIMQTEYMNGLQSGEHQFDVRLQGQARSYSVKVQVMP